ncbi:MAG TPA: hypothetical protein VFJ16_27195 [Longimicrobium sp.]|nr:hypothetical protein [Longimicrobium sp.]
MKTLDDPSAAFATPFIGAVPAAESVGDEHVPFALRWPNSSSFAVSIYLSVRNGPRTILELGFDERTHRLFDLTLVILPRDRYSAGSDPRREVPVVDGLPRCEPATWLALTRTGSFNDYADSYLRVTADVRLAVTPSEAVLYIDGIAGEVERELASGRARFGVDARGAVAYVRLTELTAREAAALEVRMGRSVIRPMVLGAQQSGYSVMSDPY